MQVHTYYPRVCGPESTGAPRCVHTSGRTGRSCGELSRPNTLCSRKLFQLCSFKDQLSSCFSLIHLTEWRNYTGARVVVVTHGAVIEMLYKRAIRGGKAGGVWNTSISIFELSDGDKWCIKLWNDISHLKESEYLESASGGSAST